MPQVVVSISYTYFCSADRWRSYHPRALRPWFGHLHWRWPVDANSMHCFAALRQLRKIRRSFPATTFQTLVVALVHSRLDYGNSVLVGIFLRRLQSVLNAAPRGIFHLKRSDHIIDALVSLQWLRVPEHIQYKIAVLAYRVIHGSAPRYLGTAHNALPTFLVDGPSVQPPSVVWSCRRSDSRLSAAQPFRLPLPPSGIHSRITLSVHQLYSHFSITLKPSCSDAHSRILYCSGPSGNDDWLIGWLVGWLE